MIFTESQIGFFGHVQSKCYGFALAKLAFKIDKSLFFICLDEKDLARVKAQIKFVNPKLRVLELANFDCEVYGNIAPSFDIISKRLLALMELTNSESKQQVVILTTARAILPKIPSEIFEFNNEKLTLVAASAFLQKSLLDYLVRHHYHRSLETFEPGCYSIRGSIIDVFPLTTKHPIRIDFFDEEKIVIRSYDEASQRSISKFNDGEEICLTPRHEVPLTKTAITKFNNQFLKKFGFKACKDNLHYQQIASGQFLDNFEKFTPLFCSKVVAYYDLIPKNMIKIIGNRNQIINEINLSLEWINEVYVARSGIYNFEDRNKKNYQSQKIIEDPVLPPKDLFLDKIPSFQDYIELADFASIGSSSSNDKFVARSEKIEKAAIDVEAGYNFNISRKKESFVADVCKFIKDNIQKYKIIFTFSHQSFIKRFLSLFQEEILAMEIRCLQVESILDVSSDSKTLYIISSALESGAKIDDTIIVSQIDLFGHQIKYTKRKNKSAEKFFSSVDLKIDDYIIHIDHGIGLFKGLETLTFNDSKHECLKLIYSGNDRLFLPVENIDKLSKYQSQSSDAVKLDKLSSSSWKLRSAKVKKDLLENAEELLSQAATRENAKIEPYIIPHDIDSFSLLCDFEETEDQLSCVEDIITDLTLGKPSERLVCGDVGFGKTEVILRASFITVCNSKQVIILVPTTLLALQHYKLFSNRFKSWKNIKVEMLSRLVNAKDKAKIHADFSSLKIDIIIATHAVFSNTFVGGDIGLVVVDEEQHFGVLQKEKVKKLTKNGHLIYLSATPIPRSLQLSLTGIRSLSLITTPPKLRLEVRNYFTPYDALTISLAINKELSRGGQIFVVVPRIKDLANIEKFLASYHKDITYVKLYGKLSGLEIEKGIERFEKKEVDLLLSTSIVESGIDMPLANTLIIFKPEMFGLSQLYQLRGRVGRSNVRGYCYFVYDKSKPLQRAARQRLETLEKMQKLGSGFSIASQDLDMRGAGNILGHEQSGHVKELGIELYHKMLKQALREIKDSKKELNKNNIKTINKDQTSSLPLENEGSMSKDIRGDIQDTTREFYDFSPKISIQMNSYIPASFIEDSETRISLYRELGMVVCLEDVYEIASSWRDKFGRFPIELQNLFFVLLIKVFCFKANIDNIEAGSRGIRINFFNSKPHDPDKLISLVSKNSSVIRFSQNNSIVIRTKLAMDKSSVEKILKYLALFSLTRTENVGKIILKVQDIIK